MNKLFFGFTQGGTLNSYCFFASWDKDEIVEYEIEDGTGGRLFCRPWQTKGKLDANLSKKFIEYIGKADIRNPKDINQYELSDIKVIVYDAPIYNVAYISGNYVGTEVSNYKYLYLALMLCDEENFGFLVEEVTDDSENKKFSGNLVNFYYSYNKITIQGIEGCQNQTQYKRIKEFKEKLTELFKNGNPVNQSELYNWDWEVVLVNENDEIFHYFGEEGQYKEFDELNMLAGYIYATRPLSEEVKQIVKLITSEIGEQASSTNLDVYKKRLKSFLMDCLNYNENKVNELMKEYEEDILHAYENNWEIESIAYPMVMGL